MLIADFTAKVTLYRVQLSHFTTHCDSSLLITQITNFGFGQR